MGETPGYGNPPKDRDLCGPRASARGPCAWGHACPLPQQGPSPAISRGRTGTGDGAECHCHPELSLWRGTAPLHRRDQAWGSSSSGDRGWRWQGGGN